VRDRPRPARTPRVFWHVWDSPVYTIGAGSFLDELVEMAGATNVFHDLTAASPTVTMEEIVRRNPDYVLAGPAGAATIRSSAKWQAVPAVRAGRILIVDTALVGRPGVRMGEAAHHLRRLIVGDSAR
jgi:ABC-type Fe3+-hydroxamate transport system substrate-binding protein